MTDLFGFAAPRPAFVDIRNTRPSAAEEKAQLALTLNQLCRTPPQVSRVGQHQYRSSLEGCPQVRAQGAEFQVLQPHGFAICNQQPAEV
jgi:hypothetical protein